MSYFAVIVTTHVDPVPAGLEEPNGVFGSRDEVNAYLREQEEDWAALVGGWPFNRCILVNEYATRQQAEMADAADGYVIGEGLVSGTRPLSFRSR